MIGGSYVFFPLNTEFQWGPISKMKSLTINNSEHLIITGYKSDLPPYQGLWSSQKHFLLTSLNEYEILHELGIDLIHKDVTALETIEIDGENKLIVGVANQNIKFYNY